MGKRCVLCLEASSGWRGELICAACRFWAKVNKTGNPNGCWLWVGCVHPFGYGQLRLKGKTIKAHRQAYTLVKGRIPDGLDVLHTCDVKLCCNPSHLVAGTHSDNMRDMYAKGRWPVENVQGERSPRAKLKTDQVREIRQLLGSLSMPKIAARYGVHQGTIAAIKYGVTWAHLH